ncbi:MAG TPA: ethylbenzene dehydrogenase-related protein [Pseudolabrys sp.]|nr:ethylbenzene dehydrogenase-related protein [Pseudolabrys sp.]
MRRRAPRKRKTDVGTVILHWVLVISLVLAALSGLRIASETPDRTWINNVDFILPRQLVWSTHMQAAIAIIAVTLAYPVYMAKARLGRRIRLDRVRLNGLLGRRQARWGAVNVALYWVLYLALGCEVLTGTLLYFDAAHSWVIGLHWGGLWLLVACTNAHVIIHFKIGGVPQLLRILRPTRLKPQAPPFDPMDLLDLLEKWEGGEASISPASIQEEPQFDRTSQFAERRSGRSGQDSDDQSENIRANRIPRPEDDVPFRQAREATRHKGPIIQSNPLLVALAATLVGTSFLLTAERQVGGTLRIAKVDAKHVPLIDGDTSDPVWRTARPVYVLTGHGSNFDGSGETLIEIRAVHDGQSVYFLFSWDDPTRSLKQLPLLKTVDGWKLLHEGYERGEEHAYNEDKFSVLFTSLEGTLAGDLTFHASAAPLPGLPRTLSGRGLHYTPNAGLFADVWQWKATSTSGGYLDDDHFGPPLEPTSAQMEGRTPYRGGFAPDPGNAGYRDNFEVEDPEAFNKVVRPLRLPKDLHAMLVAMGEIDLDANHGESNDARWTMTEDESVAYAREFDARIPVGTLVPGVIASGKHSGDRADVRCAAKWGAGRWALEVVRRIDTGSPYDVPIRSGIRMRVAAFDHTQIGHTRHVRPIVLEVE